MLVVKHLSINHRGRNDSSQFIKFEFDYKPVDDPGYIGFELFSMDVPNSINGVTNDELLGAISNNIIGFEYQDAKAVENAVRVLIAKYHNVIRGRYKHAAEHFKISVPNNCIYYIFRNRVRHSIKLPQGMLETEDGINKCRKAINNWVKHPSPPGISLEDYLEIVFNESHEEPDELNAEIGWDSIGYVNTIDDTVWFYPLDAMDGKPISFNLPPGSVSKFDAYLTHIPFSSLMRQVAKSMTNDDVTVTYGLGGDFCIESEDSEPKVVNALSVYDVSGDFFLEMSTK